MQTVLIIGAKGMMGRELQGSLTGNFDVYIDDRDTLDITNHKVVFKRIKEVHPDIVINCAAINDIEKADENVEETMQVNGYAVEHIAKACEHFKSILVQFSTYYVFNGEENRPYSEDAEKFPLNTYGKSKALGEDMALNFCSKTYIIRSSWVYGAYGQDFVKKMLEKVKRGETIQVMNSCYGGPTWSKDISYNLRYLVEHVYPFGVYHLVNDGVVSWYDFVKKVFEIKDIKTPLVSVEGNEISEKKMFQIPYACLSNNKTEPMRHWEDALVEYLRMF